MAGIFLKQKEFEESARFSIDGLQFDYQVRYSKRRSIEIRIHKRQVLVAAPLSAKKRGVEQFLHKKSGWIIKKLQKQDDNSYITQPRKFETGEDIYFLGKRYRLEIKKDIISAVKLNGEYMVISLPYSGPGKIKAQLRNWYKAQASMVFDQRLEECLKLAANIGVRYSGSISSRKMQRRWGTCTHDNKIILNSNLIFLDVEYIDYVILHELCHFREKNHSPRYYALLQAICPDYKDIRKRLNRHEIE